MKVSGTVNELFSQVVINLKTSVPLEWFLGLEYFQT